MWVDHFNTGVGFITRPRHPFPESRRHPRAAAAAHGAEPAGGAGAADVAGTASGGRGGGGDEAAGAAVCFLVSTQDGKGYR